MDKNPHKIRPLWLYILLALVTFAVYSQVIGYQFVNIDDDIYVYDNPTVQNGLTLQGIKWAFTSNRSGYWHPVTWLSLMLDSSLFGVKPWGYHLTNLLLHIANALLLFAVLKAMTGAVWQSLITAAVFALHPVNVESAAWVSERKGVLSTMFWLLTIIAYVNYSRKPGRKLYLFTIFLFMMGLMVKPMLTTLPVTLLILDYWPLEKFKGILTDKKQFLKLVIEKVPFFALSIICGIITFLGQKSVDTLANLDTVPLSGRLANASVSYGKYILKMFWPENLSVFYPLKTQVLAISEIAVSIILLVTVPVLAITLFKNYRFLLAGWLWYIMTLLPVIGLIQVGHQSMADRYAYVPLIGLFIIVVWGLSVLFAKWRYRKIASLAISAVILFSLSVNSCFQLTFWQNGIELFKHATEVTKKNAFAYCNLGAAYNSSGQYQKAIEASQTALSINPNDTVSITNIGIALVHLEQYDDAVKIFEELIKLKPKDAKIRYCLAHTYTLLNKFPQAIESHEKAIEINPQFAAAYCDLGVIYGRAGQHDKAIIAFKQAIKIKSNYIDAHANLGSAYVQIGDKKSALEQYKILQKLDKKRSEQLYLFINK